VKRGLAGLAQNLRSPIVCHDEARLIGNDLGIKGLRNGEEKPVTEVAVLRPFLVNLEIQERGLFDDQMAPLSPSYHTARRPVAVIR
jgi:hypothetical protein